MYIQEVHFQIALIELWWSCCQALGRFRCEWRFMDSQDRPIPIDTSLGQVLANHAPVVHAHH